MSSLPSLASLAGAALLAAAPAHAQQNRPVELPAVRVIADTEPDDNRIRPLGARAPQASIDHNVTQSVSVVERQEIDRSNPLSTLDLLERVPGVTVNRAGGIAGTIFMRGLDSNDMRVPMFIDGDRFRGRNTLQFMFISPSEIERVEVIRGPSASRFGSDGLAGLVNFVTRHPQGNLTQPFQVTGGEAAATYRSNGHGLQGNVALEAAGSGFDLRVYATGRRASNYDTPYGEVPNSDYRSGGGGVVLGYMPNANHRIEASLRAAYVKDGAAGTVPPYPLSVSRRDPNKVKQARLAYTGTFDDATISAVDASLYVNAFDTIVSARSVAATRTTDVRNHVIGPVVVGGRASATLPWKDTRTVAGLDFTHERRAGPERQSTVTITSGTGAGTATTSDYTKTGPNQYQSNVGVFVNTEWKPSPRWTATAAARYDWFRSDVDLDALPTPNLLPAFQAAQGATESATTGSLGLAYQATEVVELLGSVGTSFRMPWTNEMFSSGYTGTTYTIPNPTLQPERGTNVEVGTRLHFAQATVGITAFHTNYRNFLQNVTTVYQGLPATQRQNVARARIQGLELDWRWQLTRQVNVYGNASYLHATNRTTDTPLRSIAPLSGLLGVQYVGGNEAYALSGEVQWAKGQRRYDAASEYPSGGYGVVNLYAQFQLDRLGLPQLGNTQVVLGLNNLFDRAYRTAATTSNVAYARTDLNPLMEPGRSVSLTVRTRF